MLRRSLPLAAAALSSLLVGCPNRAQVSGGEGESSEGEGDEGEGEGDEGEGEGDAVCGANKPELGAGAIFFGTREPSHVTLSAAEKEAIVSLTSGNPSDGEECSGTLITNDVVLTATHCTEGIAAANFSVMFGVDDFDPDLILHVIEKTEHPELDIAMLRLERAPAGDIAVTPIRPFAGTLNESDAGETFEQSGFGVTESGSSNGRMFVAEPFDSFEEPGGYLVVNGEDRHGVCFGDSGGPSLRQTENGVRVMGALSYGDESCTGFDRYTRVDLARDWIIEFIGAIDDGPVPCGSVTAAGVCSADQKSAQRCENDALAFEACSASEACVTDGGTAHCAPNPCGDVTAFGACDGDVLRYCDGGVVVERDCGSCGDQVCLFVDSARGFACEDNPCGDLTFQGECDGNTARWCENNEVQTQDCAADGQTCGFIDNDTGFFCQ